MLDAFTTMQLEQAREAVEKAIDQRDHRIRQALAKGASSREIAAVVGVSHTWVLKIGRGS